MADTSSLLFSERVAVSAGAMREKRKELIAHPLQEIWVQLARAGLEAADKWDELVKIRLGDLPPTTDL